MSTSCGCFRFWLDDEEALEAGSLEQVARAEHLRVCPDCRQETRGIVVQRAALRRVFRSSVAEPRLSETLVAKCVDAMKRAARGERDVGKASG